MTANALARPHIGRLRLRNGDHAATITAADQRVIIRREHLEALIEDLEEALDAMEDLIRADAKEHA